MLKKVIKYTDYNGVEREEPFYFNLNKAELIELEMSVDGGLTEFITRVVQTQDQKELIKLFKSFILKAYGVKSDDGKRFIKSPEISEEFASTEAYSELFMELMSSTENMTNFVNALAPQGVTVDEAQAKKFLEDRMK
jgi:hypothetical protein